MTASREVWADLLAAHLTRPDHVGSVVVLSDTPRLWPLAEWQAPMVWIHTAPLRGQDFHVPALGQPPRHPSARERLHPLRDAAVVAEHLARADLCLLWLPDDPAEAAALAALLPPTRSLLMGLPHAGGWAAVDPALPLLPLPGLRAHASADLVATLVASGLPLDARWGLAEAQRLATALPADGLTFTPAPSAPRLTLVADGAQALVCTEPGHAHHAIQQGHAVLSASGKASLWLPYEGVAEVCLTLAPLPPLLPPATAVLHCGPHQPALAWAPLADGQTLTVAAAPAPLPAPALAHLALPRAALPAGRFCALPRVQWTLELAC
ncbi:MAG: hypothetical protein LCH73_12620 [Proteobacteria bacterium]|nr:hypothetical protein [Pseudomonadota bacterium]